jgi:hypothetical protein
MDKVVLSADSRESSKHRRVMVLNADEDKIAKLPVTVLCWAYIPDENINKTKYIQNTHSNNPNVLFLN